MESDEVTSGRPYKSRKSRPCDACRRRKVTCVMPVGPPCERCTHFNKSCTFEQGPSKRKRPAAPITQEIYIHDGRPWIPGNSHPQNPTFLFPDLEVQTRPLQDMLLPELGHLSSPSENIGAMPPVLSPQSSVESGVTRASPRGPSSAPEASLEFIPDAFSFYIGPTGVSDIHLLRQLQYDERNISRPKVKGLKYRVMDHEQDGESFVPPTIFGITDRILLDKAEPKLDMQTNEEAWSDLWRILDPTAAWHLIGLYARFVDPYFPILSRHQIPATPDTLSNMPLALLTVMCATALPFIMYDQALYTLLLRPPSSRELYALCWLGLSQELHAPTSTTLQACLILQQRPPTNLYLSDTAFTWTLMSTAVSVAQTIGLHRDASSWLSVPAWERTLRRRLWWALWTMEKWIALGRGMPTHLHDEDFDVAPLTSADMENTLSVHGDTHGDLCHLVSLTSILADIQRTYYSVRAISLTSQDLQYSLQAARSPRARLKDWRDQLPESVKCHPHERQPWSREELDGSGSLHLSYIVTHMTLFRALLRPLADWPRIIVQSPAQQADSIYKSAKAVVKGALLCVKEFVEFIEALTETQWNSFWHSWSRPNFAIAGSFMIHVLHTISPPDASRQARSETTGVTFDHFNFEDDYRDLQVWIRRWRWANRISAHGAAGVKGLTNLGLMKVETLIGKLSPDPDANEWLSTVNNSC